MRRAAGHSAAPRRVALRASRVLPVAGPKAPRLPPRRAVRGWFRETRTRTTIRVRDAYALKGKHHASAHARDPGLRRAGKRRAGSFPADLRQTLGAGERPSPPPPAFASAGAIGDTRPWPALAKGHRA